jgi:uncharacterized protein (DUF2249 family)
MNEKAAHVVELDVRPHLRKKLEPFQLIMDAVKGLGKDDLFVLHATFKPTPLFGVLRLKGFAGKAEQISADHWVSTFVNKKNKHWLNAPSIEEEATVLKESAEPALSSDTNEAKTVVLDNRGLEPPKPMIRTLAALERCRSGDEVHIHNDRVPMFLIEELHSLGYAYAVEEQPDGSAKVKIQKT